MTIRFLMVKIALVGKKSVAFLPPPPDAPPPDLAVLRDDKTNRMDGNDTEDVYSRLSMIPEPDF